MSALSSLSSSLSSSALSVSGLASGLDTTKIVDGLLAIDKQRVQNLQSQQALAQQKQTIFKSVEAKLLALQGQETQLGRPQNNVFDGRTVVSSNSDLVAAAANSSAVPGIYQLRVNALAQNQQIAAQGFDSSNAAVTHGTLTIRVGAGAAATITIDSGNDTLQGLATAINGSGAGVTAALINDGGAGQAFRLVLTSNKTGASNTIAVTNNLAADSGGAVKPIFDSASIGAASLAAGTTGTSTPTANSGAGAFTGAANNIYTFTVTTGGTVGTDDGLQIDYTDRDGAHTGTITLNAADANVFKSVAEGIQVNFAAGTLVAGDKFTIRGFVPVVQAAADASVTVGSGSGAMTVTSATNQLDSLFSGLTLDLKNADPNRPVTLTVANDTAKIKQAIQNFVGSYNDVLDLIDQQTSFDAATGVAGPMLGNLQLASIEDAIRNVMTRSVPGLPTSMNNLAALGVTVGDRGHFSVDAAKLDRALSGGATGVTLSDVRRLFALSGRLSQSGFEFVTASRKTKIPTTPYQVAVTQAATQASMTATDALAATTLLTSANNSLTIAVDNATSSTLTLAPGSYSQAALAQELQVAINANANLAGRHIHVAVVGGRLVVTSSTYGAASKLSIGTGTALSPLGFSGSESAQGVDVAGHFQVGSQQETAVGSGQVLIGAPSNPNTADLQVRVTLTPGQVGGGVSADLTLTRGVASSVDVALGSILDPINGRLETIDDGFQTVIDDIQAEIARQNERIVEKRTTLLKQFAAMETTISRLQGIGNYLATQFAQLSNLKNSTSGS